jgi:phosphoribosylamine--glycine ligase
VNTDVLLIGSGAREHALAWKLCQSARVGELIVALGNPGTARVAENVSLDPLDFAGIAALVRERRIGLVVIGPEGPLAEGLADHLSALDVPVFGPTKAAAQIEASKSFAKRLMAEAGIPTAAATVFHDYEIAVAYVRAAADPPVIKADGLAAGKGVTVARDTGEALDALRLAMLDGAFGESGRIVVVEERLTGREVSAHVFSDGRLALPMPYACDHKAVYDGGLGPNTGGMGAYSPPTFVDDRLHQAIWKQVVVPALEGLARGGASYRGTLYPGLMISDAGPQVVEFNCRFGDPETQVILPRLASDVFEPLWGCAIGDLSGVSLSWSGDACVGVVLAAGGYPGPYRQGDVIDGLDDVDEDVLVFQSGTARAAGDRLVTSGGRVMTVVACGATLEAARERAYENVDRIRFAGKHFRTDVGLDVR